MPTPPKPNVTASTPPVVDPTPHRSGHTTPHVDGELSPRLPHERDESSDSQTQAVPDPLMQQALADVEKGLVDTGRRPVSDQVYEEAVRPVGEATAHRGASEGGVSSAAPTPPPKPRPVRPSPG
jgi:hypothetical protein